MFKVLSLAASLIIVAAGSSAATRTYGRLVHKSLTSPLAWAIAMKLGCWRRQALASPSLRLAVG